MLYRITDEEVLASAGLDAYVVSIRVNGIVFTHIRADFFLS